MLRRRVALLAAVFATQVVAPACSGGPVQAASLSQQCQPSSSTASAVTPWAQQMLTTDDAWRLTRGANVTVAVLDTGVAAATPALAGRVLPGRDIANGRAANADCAGHGTFVAGLIAAAPTKGSGFIGMAPATRILPIRVSDQSQDVTPDVLAAGIAAAVRGGADIVATAITAPYSSGALRAAVSLARARDVVIVAPSTTARNQTGDVAQPAAGLGVISVAAVGTNLAPLTSSTALATVCAPGGDLTSIGPSGRGTVTGSGESLAVGFVAGTLALVRSYHQSMAAADVIRQVTLTADPVPAASGTGARCGGLVDPQAAVTAVLPSAKSAPAALGTRPAVVPPSVAAQDHSRERVAMRWGIRMAGGGVLVGLAVLVFARGRRRSWRTV